MAELIKDNISVAEASELLGVSEKTIQNMCKDGRLAFYRFGNRGAYRIIKESLAEFINRSETPSGFTNTNDLIKGENENE